MANLTKIILGLNILAAGAGIFFGITKSGKTGELMDSVATAKGESSKATSKLSKLESEKAAISKQFTDKDAEHKSIKAQYDQLAGNAGSKDAEFANLQQESSALKAEKQSWITERQNLQVKANEATDAQTKLAAAEAQVRTLIAELDEINNPTAPVKPKAPTVTAGGEVGKIANVDPRNGSIILNRGSAHGFKVGDQLNVFRNSKLIGRIEVTRLSSTNAGLSIAQRTEGLGVPAGAQFQVNDDLVKFQ
jgi:predicted RNase H-like nuclease (RuvC/YqgF family)